MGIYKQKINQINKSLGEFSKQTPKQMQGFLGLMKGIEEAGSLGPKSKELIAVACSVVSHCEWCIAFHVNKALKQGATRTEILESAWVGVLMGGGPALMYAQCVLEALDEFKA